MIKHPTTQFMALLALLGLVVQSLGPVAPVTAQDAHSPQGAPPQATPALDCAARTVGADTETMRCRFYDIAAIYGELGQLMQDSRLVDLSDDMTSRIGDLAIGDLERFVDSGVDVAELYDALTIARSEVNIAFEQQSTGRTSNGGEDWLPAPYAGMCPPDLTIPTEVIFSVTVAFQIAKTIHAGLSRACDFMCVVVGEGCNAALGCIVVDMIFMAAEFVVQDLSFCNDAVVWSENRGTYERTEALHEEHDAHQGYLQNTHHAFLATTHHTFLEEMSADIGEQFRGTGTDPANTHHGYLRRQLEASGPNADATHHGAVMQQLEGLDPNNTHHGFLKTHDTTMITALSNHDTRIEAILGDHDSAITNRLMEHDSVVQSRLQEIEASVNSRFDSLEAENLRVRLEFNLAEGPSGKAVATFQLPEKHGGHLGLARSILVQTISNMLEADQNIGQAQAKLDLGIAAMNAHEYKTAYRYFRHAYSEATKD